MLKDNVNCFTKRVGKNKLSVFVVKDLIKKKKHTNQKHLKEG